MSSKCICRMQWRGQHVRCNCSAQICQQQAQNDQAVSMSQNSQETMKEWWLQLRQTCNKGVKGHVDTGCTWGWQCSEHLNTSDLCQSSGRFCLGGDVKGCHQGRAHSSCSKWYMKRGHSAQECQHHHKQVGVQTKVAHQWHSWQAEGKSCGKRFLTNVWHWLWEYLCANCEVWHSPHLLDSSDTWESEMSSDECEQCIHWVLSQEDHLHDIISECWSCIRLCTAHNVKLIEFHQSDADPCLLLHSQKNIMLLLYVDNIVVTSAATSAVTWFKKSLAAVFKVKDLRETQKILDIWIICNCKRWTLCMDQTHYVKKMLQDLHMKTDKHKCTEISLNEYDTLCSAGPNDQRIDQRQYQQVIESLMYAVIHTCPDISFALDWLSQYLNDSMEHHGHALKKLLQYICSTTDLEIMYRPSGSQDLIGYSDSDYASDKQDQKSVLGHVYMLERGSVSWVSWKQKSVTTSITETEYMIMFMCTKTEVWLTQILRNMGLGKYLDSNSYCVSIQENETHREISPLQLRGDNQAVLTLVKDVHVHERSKHIDIVYHHIWDLHQKNQIKIDFMPSWNMFVDGLTKSLLRQNFKNFMNQLGLESSGSQ